MQPTGAGGGTGEAARWRRFLERAVERRFVRERGTIPAAELRKPLGSTRQAK